MSGPRILLAVVLVCLALAWLALAGNPDADRERGLEESEQALAAVEQELLAFDPLYQEITSRGLMMGLKTAHEDIRSELASLRAERLRIADDPDLGRHERLPAFRELVDRSDELLARARSLREHVEARYEFMQSSSPLLGQARELRDRLLGAAEDDPARAARIHELAGRFSELEQLARTADRTLQVNLGQGGNMGQAAIKGLRDLIAAQQALLDEIQAARR